MRLRLVAPVLLLVAAAVFLLEGLADFRFVAVVLFVLGLGLAFDVLAALDFAAGLRLLVGLDSAMV